MGVDVGGRVRGVVGLGQTWKLCQMTWSSDTLVPKLILVACQQVACQQVACNQQVVTKFTCYLASYVAKACHKQEWLAIKNRELVNAFMSTNSNLI